MLAEVGGQKIYDYNVTFNGFAAKLTERRRRDREAPGVLSVEGDTIYTSRHLDDAALPRPRREEGPVGSARRPGREGNGKKDGAGENIIIGDIDSGITPESLSFTDQKIKKDKLGKVVYEQVPARRAAGGLGGHVPDR